ncbi:unnamed protein product [Closterium sp. NIES-53]
MRSGMPSLLPLPPLDSPLPLSPPCSFPFPCPALPVPYGKKVVKPKAWKHPTPLSQAELTRMREEFWDTAPHYGGQREIWDALKAATEGDRDMAQVILELAGVVVDVPDMSVCYDERGAKYELPHYVLSDPINLIVES